MGRDRRGRRQKFRTGREWGATGAHPVVFLLMFLYSALSSSPFSSFPVIYVRPQAGLGQDQTGPTRTAIETRDKKGGGSTGTCHVIFCSLLSFFLLLALLLFHCRHGRPSNAGRDKGA